MVDEKTARQATSLAAAAASDDTRLLGDLRVEATWSDDADLDLAILHPDGQRVSWLGAPTRELISARDVLARGREGLALNGAKPGEYAIEIVRSGGGSGTVRGELTVFAAGETRHLPFTPRWTTPDRGPGRDQDGAATRPSGQRPAGDRQRSQCAKALTR